MSLEPSFSIERFLRYATSKIRKIQCNRVVFLEEFAVYDSTCVRTQVYGKQLKYIIMILVLLPGARGSLCLVRTIAKVADYSGCAQPDSGARQISPVQASLRGRG